MEGAIRRFGISLAIHDDRHGVFKFNGRARIFPSRWVPPSSPGPWGSWASSQSLPVLPKPGVGKGWLAPPGPAGQRAEVGGGQDPGPAQRPAAGLPAPFNAHFRVPAQKPWVAYRTLDSSLSLEQFQGRRRPGGNALRNPAPSLPQDTGLGEDCYGSHPVTYPATRLQADHSDAHRRCRHSPSSRASPPPPTPGSESETPSSRGEARHADTPPELAIR